MKIKVFQHLDTSPPGLVEEVVNKYLVNIKDENIVNIQMLADAEGDAYVMVVTK